MTVTVYCSQCLTIFFTCRLSPHYISDEATSALDAQSEHEVKVALDRIMKVQYCTVYKLCFCTIKAHPKKNLPDEITCCCMFFMYKI
jgi:hypothetical protein